MTPREAVNALAEKGLTQSQIVDSLGERGVHTTQATISRIGSGDFRNPRFEVGQAVIALAESLANQETDAA